jgi:hypothetical protein
MPVLEGSRATSSRGPLLLAGSSLVIGGRVLALALAFVLRVGAWRREDETVDLHALVRVGQLGAWRALLVECMGLDVSASLAAAKDSDILGFEARQRLGELLPCEIATAAGTRARKLDVSTHAVSLVR